MSITTINFIKHLVASNPVLEPILAEHIEDNDIILPHVFFGDLVRYLKNPESKYKDKMQLLRSIGEDAKSASKEVRELLSVSFLENL